MRPFRLAVLLASFVLAPIFAGCGGGQRPDQPDDARREQRPRGPFSVTPRTEDIRVERSAGAGAQVCQIYLYEWNAAAPGCVMSITHCNREGACLACADERRVACGAKVDLCGEEVQCACPVGAPEPVPDPPGVVVLSPDGSGVAFSAPGEEARCRATPTTLAGAPTEDAPCMVAIHECEGPAQCVDRMEMLSCRVRGEICGRPVVCRCPATETPPPATPPARSVTAGPPCG